MLKDFLRALVESETLALKMDMALLNLKIHAMLMTPCMNWIIAKSLESVLLWSMQKECLDPEEEESEAIVVIMVEVIVMSEVATTNRHHETNEDVSTTMKVELSASMDLQFVQSIA